MTPLLSRYHAKYISTSTTRSQIIQDIITNNMSILTSYYTNLFNKLTSSYQSPRPQPLSDLNTIDYNIIAPNSSAKTINELVPTQLQQLATELININPVPETINSPNYNPTLPYVPRSKRKEWTTVGLLGKIYVYDNGSCIPGSTWDCINGIAVPGSKWFVLNRISSNTIRVLFK